MRDLRQFFLIKVRNVLLILFLFLAFFSATQDSESGVYSETSEGNILFSSDEPLEIVLKTDIGSLLKNKKDDEYQEGEITIYGKSYPMRLKARGNYRRENCSFPPVTLNFSKTNFEDKSLDQLEKLKLVNACKLQKTYEQYIFREYLIYRAFNLFTDKSFKVRLLKIDYVDSKEKVKTTTNYGFVIEDQYMLANRLGGMMVKREGIRDNATNREQMVMLSIFQFMIGNTDWQVARLHNLKMLKINQITEPTPYVIPYDFDYTGMVNAAYAIPSPVLGIDNLRERLFWGKCFTEAELKMAIDQFFEKKEVLYDLYNNFEFFDKVSRKESIDFLNSFYDIIGDKKRWEYYFMKTCKE